MSDYIRCPDCGSNLVLREYGTYADETVLALDGTLKLGTMRSSDEKTGDEVWCTKCKKRQRDFETRNGVVVRVDKR